jgi:hypothetical protein
VGIVFVVGSYVFVRDSMQGFDGALEARELLEQRYGAPDEYEPSASGAVEAERMQAFLRVRELTAPAREQMHQVLEPISITEEQARELEEGSIWEKLSFVGGSTKNVLGLPAAMGDLFETRNRALLDSGMGLGEYTYIYTIVYYSWLGRSPDDDAQPAGVEIEEGAAEPAPLEGVRSIRRVPRRVQRDLTDMLRRQLGAVDGATGTELTADWRERLAAEIAEMQEDSFRIPWQDGLPQPIEASLEPYRVVLEASFDPQTDEFELLRPRKEGMSIKAE